MKSEFSKLGYLVARNIKLYFKDKTMFFVSLITPLILVVLFLTFLGNVYTSSLLAFVPEGMSLDSSLVKAFTGGWLFSSILTTSCITVSLCSNLMVSDKISKANLDYQISPVKKSTLQIGYTISNFFTTFIICFALFLISLIYLAIVGWYLSFVDILLIFSNMVLTILMGTIIASIVGLVIKSQGALSAICTLVSSMYGFICGAYMPISQFSTGIQNFIGFIPGTYSTVLFRNYYMRGTLNKMSNTLPKETIEGIRKGFDGSYTFFGKQVPLWAMFVILISVVALLFTIYILISFLKKRRKIR